MIEVLSVASEVYPLIKTGGLADVAGALPGALTSHSVSMRTLIPGYPSVMEKLSGGRVVKELDDLFGVPAKLIAARVEGLDVIVIDAPVLYDRPGNPYVSPDGRTTGNVSQPWDGSRPSWPWGSSRAIDRRSCTAMTGRRDWHLPISSLVPIRTSRP